MSKEMLWGATLPGCVVLALVWTMLALSGGALADPPDGNGDHHHGGGGGGGGGTIAVTVTFQDRPGDRLMSDCHDCPTTCDCLSPYIHKVDKVSTGIGSNGGNFFLKLTKGNQPAIRTLFFDFSDCIEGPCNPPFLQGSSVRGANMFTSGSGIDLRAMAVGDVSEFLSLVVTLDLNSVDLGLWQLFFGPVKCEDSTNITVRRIDADSWEIEAGLDDIACLAENVGGGELMFSGLYHMPFKITVQAIPD